MKPTYALAGETFVITQYNQAQPFSSFLPGIAGPFGKPMWVFYANRGQCVASFGVRNKNGAMLEFNPANKAYATTSLQGFRTFVRVGEGRAARLYEPFRGEAPESVTQTLFIRAHEFELEEICPELGLRFRALFFTAPGENLPVLIRELRVENIGKKPLAVDILDGLPQIVPFGLTDGLLKQMSRTMEAFAEIRHTNKNLPFYKLKIEPSDRPEVEWINGGFFAFAEHQGKSLPMIVDPDLIFGSDTSFDRPERFFDDGRVSGSPRTESMTGCAFSHSRGRLKNGDTVTVRSFYGQTDAWEIADAYRQRVRKNASYVAQKRDENRALLDDLTAPLALHSGMPTLGAYSRQAFLDNFLRGGQPMVLSDGKQSQVFHYYSRKHGDMERDYNFFELSPTYFSQGNGNFRDVNQNRRSELLVWPEVNATNIETFFNLLQLDGFNPLVIQFETFYVEAARWPELEPLFKSDRDAWRALLSKPFNPGDLAEKLLKSEGSPEKAFERLRDILLRASKVQDAVHGEGYWVDHWTYNLDLIENFVAVFPDRLKALFVDRRDFTYFDSDHMVQPRHKKYVLREDGAVRQMKAVVKDPEKLDLFKQRDVAPRQVRTKRGTGVIYKSSLLAKVLGLVAVKAASLDPFGMGIEMEADKPGWCDAMNGLPGLIGSSVNETFELRRWVQFLQQYLPLWLSDGESHPVAEEIAGLMRGVRDALSLGASDDFYRTWDSLASLRERFREETRKGVTGQETDLSAGDIRLFLEVLQETLGRGLRKAFRPDGLCTTYFINEATQHELLPMPALADPAAPKPAQTVKVLQFKQIPVSPFLEGPVHALRVQRDPDQARKLYNAVHKSDLYDRKLGMFRLNVSLAKDSFEIGRSKIFSPGWLENESIFLHMAYKFLLETLRSGLAKEFFADFKKGLVAFQNPKRYGRSILENSSFIASSSFSDPRVHGRGFVARLTGATAEWLSMIFFMGLGAQPFRWENNQLRFEPQPTLAGWLFSRTKTDAFEKDTFGLKLFGRTWIVYHNPSKRDTFGPRATHPVRFTLQPVDGSLETIEGSSLGHAQAERLRQGRYARVTIELA